ncbi:MAG: SMP-30/gluconolactonase/LRE family protein [Hyphomonadaceae bacterium]|jgi:arylesterase/paraoxonase|nr:SMP-30/gluconolactonase/LRE family protein [Hyphomonadaceae bacterium]
MSTSPRPVLLRPSTWLIVALIVVALLSYTFFRAWVRAGEMTRLTWRFDGTCTLVPGIAGAEDMALDRERRVLWVSSDDRRPGKEGVPGAIHAIAFDAPTLAANPVTPVGRTMDESVSPHGLSLLVAADGSRVLGVVNHPKGHLDHAGTTVDIYDIGEDNSLTLRRSVKVPGLSRINDIAMSGPDSFYATSESDAAQGSLAELAGFILDNDRTGAIWHVAGDQATKVAGGLAFANSVALSPDGKRLYATGTIDRTLHIYDRNPATDRLTKLDAAFLGTGLDNLDVEPDGRIWLAAHPRLMTFFGHAQTPEARFAPSQILIVEPAADGAGGKIDQVLLQDGSAAFSGASVAVRDGSRMVLGSVFSPGLQACTLPQVWKHSEAHPALPLIDPARDDAIKAARKAEEEAARKEATGQ